MLAKKVVCANTTACARLTCNGVCRWLLTGVRPAIARVALMQYEAALLESSSMLIFLPALAVDVCGTKRYVQVSSPASALIYRARASSRFSPDPPAWEPPCISLVVSVVCGSTLCAAVRCVRQHGQYTERRLCSGPLTACSGRQNTIKLRHAFVGPRRFLSLKTGRAPPFTTRHQCYWLHNQRA